MTPKAKLWWAFILAGASEGLALYALFSGSVGHGSALCVLANLVNLPVILILGAVPASRGLALLLAGSAQFSIFFSFWLGIVSLFSRRRSPD